MPLHRPLALRSTAAACHLAALTGIGAVIGPWLLGRYRDDDEFVLIHSKGAIHYQLGGLIVFGLAYLLRHVPARILGLSAVWTEAAGTLFWVVYLCAATLYICGLFALAAQAFSGQDFEFLGYRPEIQSG